MFHIVVCFYPLPCFVVTLCRVLLLPFAVFCCYPLSCFVVTLCRVLLLPFAVFCCYPLSCLVVTLCRVSLLPFAVFRCYPLPCFVVTLCRVLFQAPIHAMHNHVFGTTCMFGHSQHSYTCVLVSSILKCGEFAFLCSI